MKCQSFLGLIAMMLVGCNVDVVIKPTASPSASPSPSVTPSPTASPSPTPVSTPTPTPTAKPTPTPIPTPVPTATPTPTPAPSSSVYTPLKPSADSRMIYVAASGDDKNPGTIASPVKTFFKAQALIRTGFPDWMLIRRGDKFKENFITDPVGKSWHWGGRSEVEPMVITSYSDPKAPSNVRPEINTADQSGFITWGSSNFALVGLNFHNAMRDPASPDFVTPVKVEPTGLRFGGNTKNWLIEDCVFDRYANNLIIDAQGAVLFNFSNIKLRYNIIKNSYGNNRSQGLYAGNVNGLLIEGNIFDHNGWTEETAKTKTWNFMAQNHNIYLRHDNTGVVVKNNMIVSGADCGLQLRAGGIAQDNLFVQNTTAITAGLVNGGALLKGGVTAEIAGNVVLDGRGDGQAGGFCMQIGNLRQAHIHDNICARVLQDPKQYGYALMLERGNGVTNPTEGSGIQNTTVENNLFYAWSRGLYVENVMSGGASGSAGFANLLVQNNQFQAILNKEIQHDAKVNLAFETMKANVYSSPSGQASLNFQVGQTNVAGTTYDWANFVKVLEPLAVYKTLTYPHPNLASVEAYNKSVGGNGTLSGFLADVENQSKLNYQESRSTPVILKYLRAQFGR